MDGIKDYKGFTIVCSKNNIFDHIQEITADEIYKDSQGRTKEEWKNAWKRYNKRTHDEVDIWTYFDYCVWEHDYVPMYHDDVYFSVKEIYPEVDKKEFETHWSKVVYDWYDINK